MVLRPHVQLNGCAVLPALPLVCHDLVSINACIFVYNHSESSIAGS
jgi:hypothetical protein